VKSLPLIIGDGWGASDKPDSSNLSPDKNTLYYQYVFNSRAVMDPGTTYEKVLYEKGTYRYTVDIASGNVSMEFLAG